MFSCHKYLKFWGLCDINDELKLKVKKFPSFIILYISECFEIFTMILVFLILFKE